MRAKLIDGRGIAAAVRAQVADEVAELATQGVRPGLAVVLVGDDPASQVYVRMKTRACEEAGMGSRDLRLPADVSQEALLAEIDRLNQDSQVHGILVQLPIPAHLDQTAIMERILPDKDVDGFHPINVGRLASGDPRAFRPATPAGIQEMLRHIEYDPAGRHAVIVGRSNIVGKPMAQILLQKEPWANATVTVAHSHTRDLGAITRQADLLIVAVGRPECVRGDMIREGAVVIDVGVNRVPDSGAERGYRLVGDVVFEEAAERADWITPVPGGVGPMTIAMLMCNTVTAARALTRRPDVETMSAR
ncbi:MAG: bifunctional methylenetetrahydrofolate dehydrogenase/methenyltetrahydrofolate cyclohydrolase FolD [Gemmatimonadota bacterium]